MSIWRQVTRGVRALRNRRAVDEEIAEEVNHYLEEATAAFIAQGVPPDEARRAARLEIGNATAVREQVRDYGWENGIETLFADLRYAARRLAANPGFTAISLLTLALGIGASTAIFSVINGVLLRPLPYPQSDRLVALLHTAPGLHIKELNLAASLYLTYREENHAFQDVAMWSGDSWTVTGVGEPQEVAGLSVSDRFLSLLGVAPELGRAFTGTDEDPKSERIVMLSDGYWRSRFGADPSVVGRRVLLDGNASTVVGVLPPSFQFMDRKISMIAPFRFRRSEIRLISFCCQGVARLKPGVTLAEANADVARMLPIAAEKFPMNPGWNQNSFKGARIAPRLRFLKDVLIGDIGRTLWVLMGAVGILLSIACANVANLLLVRADGRQQELAIRAALGARWGRIARELLIESTLLSVAGGALGVALADGTLRLLVASDLPHLPRMQNISIDLTVLAFALIVSVASGLLFGLLPVFRYARDQVTNRLRGGGRSLTGSRERHRARRILVIVQMALALVLLIGSGLMIRTFRALRHIEPGFSGATELETVRVAIPETQVSNPKVVVRMENGIIRKIGAIPGVSTAAAINDLPLDGGESEPIFAKNQLSQETVIPPVRRFKYISPGYISTVGSRLIAGRDLTWDELFSAAPVALISENLARELWHDPGAALGKQIRATSKDSWREVVGVVVDLRDDGIDQKPPTIIYWPILQTNFDGGDSVIRSLTYIIRSPRAGSTALRKEIQAAVASVNATLPVSDVMTLESVYERSLSRTTFALVLIGIAGSMALILGVIGIYGVISYSVSQRKREIGIRLAVGATLQEVTRLFVRHGLAMTGVGAICGLLAALATTRLMESLLFEVSPADPATYIVASVGMISAAFLGSYLPARKAASLDPVETLRTE